jgi:hypothetical protein
MAKRKPPAELPDEPIIERVVVLLVTLRSRADVLRQCTEHKDLMLAPDVAELAIAEALRRINLAAQMDFDRELGAAKTRLAELYQKVSKVQDFKTALSTVKELNKLLGLYPGKRAADDPAATDQADDSDALAELAAAREHLAPLVDAGDDESLDEIARRVVALFTSKR